MRIVFMGTPEFAVPTLELLAADERVVAVYTRPDAVSGRGARTRSSPVAQFAEHRGLVVRKPATLRGSDAASELMSLAPDLIVVAAYGAILPAEVLDVPPRGCINIHGSLLPRWRGAAPVQRAILAGDEMTGVSIMRMEVGLDTGPYCATASTPIGDKNAIDLTQELADLGARLLLETLPSIEQDRCSWTIQDAGLVTYAEKISRIDVRLDPSLDVLTSLRRIRASGPTAPCRVLLGEKGVTVMDGTIGTPGAERGRALLTPRGIEVGVTDGSILLTRIKPDGKGEMDAAAWARGLRTGSDLSWRSQS